MALELRALHGRLSAAQSLTRELVDSGRRTVTSARTLLRIIGQQPRDPCEPVPGLLREADPHSVRDALAEVRVRYLRQPGTPLYRVACEVYDEQVDAAASVDEFVSLQAAGDQSLMRDRLPRELADRFRRDPNGTRALLGFLVLVRESYGYPPEA